MVRTIRTLLEPRVNQNMSLTKTYYRTLFSVLLLGLLPRTASAASPEAIFQDAVKYTVKVRTMIEMPFGIENKGAFTGTGFVADVDQGWIVTNAHVAGRSPSRVEVAFRDSDFFAVDKVYIDPHLDVAVLRAPTRSFPEGVISASPECQDEPPIGHPVGAFGHPWSLPFTGTRGIISGSTVLGGSAWLQTDAPINNGNSGGPLLSMQTGRLVGINTAGVDKTKTENLNFAVSMKYVCQILTLMHEGKDPSPPRMPIRFLDYDDYRQELVVAATYFENGADAPLKAGDVILGVDNAPDAIPNETHLVHLLRGKRGDINLRILRDGKDLLTSFNVRPAEKLTRRQGIYVSGLIIAPSGYFDEPELNLGKALMVHHVKGGSVSHSEKIKQWDFIKTVDGKQVNNIEELFAFFADASEEQRDIDIVFKRIYDTGRQLYSYRKVSLPVEGLARIETRLGKHELAGVY